MNTLGFSVQYNCSKFNVDKEEQQKICCVKESYLITVKTHRLGFAPFLSKISTAAVCDFCTAANSAEHPAELR